MARLKQRIRREQKASVSALTQVSFGEEPQAAVLTLPPTPGLFLPTIFYFSKEYAEQLALHWRSGGSPCPPPLVLRFL